MTAATGMPRMNIRAALTTPARVPDHVLPGLPTGAVGALVAAGGIGKTMFLTQLSLSVAAALPMLGDLVSVDTGGTRKPSKVVLVVAEEAADEMQRRLHAIVAATFSAQGELFGGLGRAELLNRLDENLEIFALGGLYRLTVCEHGQTAEGLKVLRDASVGARLVVIDPIRQVHVGDENDPEVMTGLVQSLQSIAVKNKCAVLLAHHTNKASTFNGQGDKAGASRGSSAFTDALRWQLNLSQAEDSSSGPVGMSATDRRSMVRFDLAKANYIAARPPAFFRRGPGGVLLPWIGQANSEKRSRK